MEIGKHSRKLVELRKAIRQGTLTSEGLLPVEGPILLEEAHRSGIEIVELFVRAGTTISAAKPNALYEVPADVFKTIQDTERSQGVIATVRLRQRVTKGAGSRTKALMMAFKLLAMAEERWRKVNGSELLPLVRAGVRFVDGVQDNAKNSGAGEVKETAA